MQFFNTQSLRLHLIEKVIKSTHNHINWKIQEKNISIYISSTKNSQKSDLQ